MSHLQRLPTEAFAMVLSFLPTADDVASVACINRWAHNLFLGSQGPIVRQVLINQFGGKDLAMCLARYAAVTAPWKQQKDGSDVTIDNQGKYVEKITEFCDRYLAQQGTKLHILAMECSLKMASRIISFDKCANRLAEYVATRNVEEDESNITPSKTEIARVKRSFYILDILCQLLHSSPVTREDHRGLNPDRQDTAFTKFWTCFPPWETVQMEALEWTLEDLVDSAYVSKHGRTKKCVRVVQRHDAIKMVLIMGVEALPPLLLKEEFPAAWEDLFNALRIKDTSGGDSATLYYPRVRVKLHEDVFRWFSLPKDPANDDEKYNTTIDTLDLNRYTVTDGDTGTRDVWLWLLNCNPGVQVDIPFLYHPYIWFDASDLPSGCQQVLYWDRKRMEYTYSVIPAFEDLMKAYKGWILNFHPSNW